MSKDTKNTKVEEYDGPMANYKVLGEIIPTDEEGNKQEALEIGSIVCMPKEIGDKFVEDKVAEFVEDFIPETNEKPSKSADKKGEVKNSPATMPQAKVTKIEVYNKDNQVVRVYSLVEHGKDFMKLAKSFADKFSFFIR